MLSKKMLCCVPVVLLLLNEGLPSVARGAEPEPPPASMRSPRPENPEPLEDLHPGVHRRFGERHRRPSYENLPDEAKLDLEEFMEEYFPEQFEDLMRLQERVPEAFSRKVNRLLPPLRVQEVRISTRILALARRIADDPDEDPDADVVNRLRQLLEQRFDLRQKIHRNEAKRLERRLAKARERLDRTAADKKQIIARELEEMLARRHEPRRPRPPRDRPVPPGEPGP